MVRLNVRVQPGARSDRLIGWMENGVLKIAVSAPPEGGKANAAVAELLGRVLGIRPRALTVRRGLASRSKLVEIETLDEQETMRRLNEVLAGRGTGRP